MEANQAQQYELNYAVQRTIDRIIFLCMCEDREIDALVYELYGLTEEEITIVEGGQE